MEGCSRIRKASTEKSKSMDFSDLSFVPKTPDPIKKHTSKPKDNKENQNKNTDTHDSIQEHETEDTAGEIFGVILNRKLSVSSKPSNNFISEKQCSSSVGSALKRTLSSIKRSSSVSSGYCRMHHQSDPTAADDDESVMLNRLQTRSGKKKGKVFKTCKRILGL